MEKKSRDFSIKEAQRLANSPQGQQLMQLLQKSDSAGLEKAMAAANAGNYTEAGKLLNDLLASPEAQQLIRQLGGRYGGL